VNYGEGKLKLQRQSIMECCVCLIACDDASQHPTKDEFLKVQQSFITLPCSGTIGHNISKHKLCFNCFVKIIRSSDARCPLCREMLIDLPEPKIRHIRPIRHELPANLSIHLEYDRIRIPAIDPYVYDPQWNPRPLVRPYPINQDIEPDPEDES
jgi:hypothetical protein